MNLLERIGLVKRGPKSVRTDYCQNIIGLVALVREKWKEEQISLGSKSTPSGTIKILRAIQDEAKELQSLEKKHGTGKTQAACLNIIQDCERIIAQSFFYTMEARLKDIEANTTSILRTMHTYPSRDGLKVQKAY